MVEDRDAGFGEKLRDVMVDEYLNVNPESSRPEIETRSVDGKVVCDTIVKSVGAISKRTRFEGPEEEQEFFDEQIGISGNARYQACQKSIAYSGKIIDSLLSSQHCDFSEQEKTDNLGYLEQNERRAVEYGQTVEDTKSEIVAMMEGKVTQHTKLKLVPSRVRASLVTYIRALVDQMKVQGNLFKREHDLGERFRTFTRDFIKEHVQDAKGNVKKETMETIRRVYLLAKKDGEELPEIVGDGLRHLRGALTTIEGRLEKSRLQFQTMEKIVAYLEKLIVELENYKEDDGQKGPRMARSARSGDRRGRR